MQEFYSAIPKSVPLKERIKIMEDAIKENIKRKSSTDAIYFGGVLVAKMSGANWLRSWKGELTPKKYNGWAKQTVISGKEPKARKPTKEQARYGEHYGNMKRAKNLIRECDEWIAENFAAVPNGKFTRPEWIFDTISLLRGNTKLKLDRINDLVNAKGKKPALAAAKH